MAWKKEKLMAHIHSPWLDIYAEHWLDDRGQRLDYWRVEKKDSLIIIPIWQNYFLLPEPQFRVGIGRETLDFPGGRTDLNFEQDIALILKKELQIAVHWIASIKAINSRPYWINSSFSNQRLYGFIARIHPQFVPPEKSLKIKEASWLIEHLDCLQCRSILYDYLFQEKSCIF